MASTPNTMSSPSSPVVVAAPVNIIVAAPEKKKRTYKKKVAPLTEEQEKMRELLIKHDGDVASAVVEFKQSEEVKLPEEVAQPDPVVQPEPVVAPPTITPIKAPKKRKVIKATPPKAPTPPPEEVLVPIEPKPKQVGTARLLKKSKDTVSDTSIACLLEKSVFDDEREVNDGNEEDGFVSDLTNALRELQVFRAAAEEKRQKANEASKKSKAKTGEVKKEKKAKLEERVARLEAAVNPDGSE